MYSIGEYIKLHLQYTSNLLFGYKKYSIVEYKHKVITLICSLV